LKKKSHENFLHDNPKSHSVPVILSRRIGESSMQGEDIGDDEGDSDDEMDDGDEDDELDGDDDERSDVSSSFLLLLIPTTPPPLLPLSLTLSSLFSWLPALTSLVVM
jgi:hypothetical protein